MIGGVIRLMDWFYVGIGVVRGVFLVVGWYLVLVV